MAEQGDCVVTAVIEKRKIDAVQDIGPKEEKEEKKSRINPENQTQIDVLCELPNVPASERKICTMELVPTLYSSIERTCRKNEAYFLAG